MKVSGAYVIKNLSNGKVYVGQSRNLALRKNQSARSGKNISKEHNARISQANKGSNRTEESKVKMREAAKQRPPISEETRQKMREAGKMQRAREEAVKNEPLYIKG